MQNYITKNDLIHDKFLRESFLSGKISIKCTSKVAASEFIEAAISIGVVEWIDHEKLHINRPYFNTSKNYAISKLSILGRNKQLCCTTHRLDDNKRIECVFLASDEEKIRAYSNNLNL